MRTSTARRHTHLIASTALLLIAFLTAPATAIAAEEASDDTVAAVINTGVSFDVMDNDPDELTFVDHTSASHGQLSADGSGAFEYLPHANYLGQDSFSYTAEDDSGTRSTATVTIAVTGEVTGVEARSDRASIDEDTAVSIAVTDNDGAGPDNLPFTVAIDTPPGHGHATLQADGSITYSPDANWSGSDELRYSISDGVTAHDARISIAVRSVADLPDAVDDAILTDQGQAVEIEILANDTEADGDAVELVEHAPALHGVVQWSESDRMITYEPNQDFYGADRFTYTVADVDGSDTATVAITVDGRPASTDDIANASSGMPATIVVLANDADPESQPLEVSSVSRPEHGDALITADFAIRYRADAGFTGVDTFTYTIADPRGNSATATVTVNVAAVGNLAPTAGNDEYIVDEDSPGNTLDVLANDLDPNGQPLAISIDRSPEFGDIIVGANQVVTYTPDPNFGGVDTFLYSISDGTSGFDTATVTLIVQPVNDPPAAVADAFTVDEDVESVLGVLGNDTDPDGDSLIVESVDDPPFGTATINERGELVYVADEEFSGPDSFSYTMSDTHGGTATASATISVIPVNDAPRARNDSAATDSNQATEIAVLANDKDTDDRSLGLAIEVEPAHGTAVVTASNGIRYEPQRTFEGVDRFRYVATDAAGSSDVATVIVIVGDPDLSPVAVKDDARTSMNEPVAINVLENDMSPIDSRLKVTETTEPEHGSVQISKDTTIVYTPADGYEGKDSFTYSITDADGRTDKVRVYINVRPQGE